MEEGQNIVYIVLFGTVLMLTVGMTLVFFVTTHRKKYLIQQNELQKIAHEKDQAVLKAIISAQEQERNRIAKNIHDSIGAELSMFKLNFSHQIYLMKDSDEQKLKIKNELNNLDNTINSISSICKNLYPLSLQNIGIAKTLEELTKRINDNSSINCEFSCTILDDQFGENHERLLNIYRVFQETINNILKHSECTLLDVSISTKGENIEFNFAHDGILFTNENERILKKLNKGIGLSSISNRVSVLAGTLDYIFKDEQSIVLIKLPINYGN